MKVESKIKRQYSKYVSLNILGMLGMSCYIIVDSYFISKAAGTNGLAALNIALPLYNIIYAIGEMLGMGSAIRYTIGKARGDKDTDRYFFNAMFFTTVFGLIFTILGVFAADKVVALMGGDATILETGLSYTRILLCFGPLFMWNFVLNAYVRNDKAPLIAMLATLLSSVFNIVFDYVFMFPCKMGMTGAALATALAPGVGCLVCLIHLLSKKCNVRFIVGCPSIRKMLAACKVGISSFVLEISNGIIILVFNILILGITGNVGVAAYGIIANIALVVAEVFNGIAQGSQPLISRNYGLDKEKEVKWLMNASRVTAISAATVMYVILYVFADSIVDFFNAEQDVVMAEYAVTGVKLYFIGIFIAGFNIVSSSFFSAIERAKEAFIISILRGLVILTIVAWIMSKLFGMTGVWTAYFVAELLTMIVVLIFGIRIKSYTKNR